VEPQAKTPVEDLIRKMVRELEAPGSQLRVMQPNALDDWDVSCYGDEVKNKVVQMLTTSLYVGFRD